MAAAEKRALLAALLLKKQVTIGTAVVPAAATDGVRIQLENRTDAWVDPPKYAFDGNMGPSVGNLGMSLSVAPSGRSIEAKAPIRAKGAGVLYSASVVPADMHIPLQIAGLTAAGTFGAGTEKWVYSPTADTNAYAVATGYYYADGELRQAIDVIADWEFDFTNQRPPIHRFAFKGVYAGVTDVTCPSVTYGHNTITPPLASGITFSVGAVTGLVVRSGNFKLNRDTGTERVPLSGSGTHLGFVPGGRDPRLMITVERPAIATYSYETIMEAASQAVVTLGFNQSVQYNRWKIVGAQAQLKRCGLARDGAVSLLELEYSFPTSTPIAEDDFAVTFD